MPARVLYDDPGILYDDPDVLYEQPTPEAPKGIEAWVSTKADVYIAHLDRSEESPFRFFRFHPERNAAGVGSLEYHLDNELLREHPTLFAKGNLVHMRYRTREFVWVIRENGSGLGSDEVAGDWVQVTGPGFWPRRRMVLPTPMANGANLDPSLWATQWRSFVNRAAGELLWDVIVDTNARFATQIIRGTVETTGADGITTDYRFEDIGDDVIPSVLAARGGEVRFDGLTFNYYNPGHGDDLSDSVIFEEGADLLSLKYTNTNRDGLTWIVGEGVGEGVFAKLAVSEDEDAPERLEGYYAAKDVGNLPLLQLMTAAALDEHDDDLEALAIEVSEARFKAFDDFDLSDTIRVIARSRGIDHTAQIVAMYVAEEDDRVRIAFDLGAPISTPDIDTAEKVKAALTQIGVRDKQPQGQFVPYSISGQTIIDTAHPRYIHFRVPESVYVLKRTIAEFYFSEFWAPATAASSGGSSSPTTASGGSSSPTSGASSASSSASGGSSTPTTSTLIDNTQVNNTSHNHVETGTTTGVASNTHTHSMGHDHTVTIGSHQHDISHTHGVTIAAHDHGVTVPAHTHGLTYEIHEEAMPGSIDVIVGVSRREGASWDLLVSISGLTDEIEEIDLSEWVALPGSYRLAIESAAGAPQGGRLSVSVSGSIEGAIKSA